MIGRIRMRLSSEQITELKSRTQPLELSTTAVTIRGDARLAPALVVAHLER